MLMKGVGTGLGKWVLPTLFAQGKVDTTGSAHCVTLSPSQGGPGRY